MTNNSNESNKNPIAESNNDYDISIDIETRIAELRTCPVWEDHVRMLEDLLRKADEVASKYYNDDVETTLKLQRAEAEVEMFRLAIFSACNLNAKLKSEVEMLKKPRYPFESFEQFCSFLTSTNLIDELAVSDPEGWDGGAELSRIEKAFDQYLEETNK